LREGVKDATKFLPEMIEITKKAKCVNCYEYLDCRESSLSWVLFAVGILATIALRVIQPLNFLNPLYGKVAWYVGVLGFFIFFLYQFRTHHNRHLVIEDRGLIPKIKNKEYLTNEDYEALNVLFCEVTSRRDQINFIFISVFSVIALIVALYFDISAAIG
jgi:hypothetical protein